MAVTLAKVTLNLSRTGPQGPPGSGGGGGGTPSDTTPQPVSTTGSAGASSTYSRGDHAHALSSSTIASAGGVVASRQVLAGTGLTGGGDLSADRTLAVSFGASGTTACVGNDPRLSDSRAPTGAASGDLSGSYPAPTVSQARGLRESGGTTLAMGAVADGQALRRSGSTVAGVALPTASSSTPADVSSAGAAGVSADYARADHVHAHGNQAGGLLHAEATNGLYGGTESSGFQDARDKDIIFARRRSTAIADDFFNGVSSFWSSFPSGAGAANFIGVSTTNNWGIASLSTGTTAAGVAGFGTSLNLTMVLGGGVVRYTAVVRVPTLATAGEDFDVYLGFGNVGTGTRPTRGLFFSYRRGANGANWFAESDDAGPDTTIDTGVAVSTGWVRLDIVADTTAGTAAFYIDGAVVATLTTNLPTTQACGVLHVIAKTAGTTARTFEIDYVGIRKDHTTAR